MTRTNTLALIACSVASLAACHAGDELDDTPQESATEPYEPVCEPPGTSVCGSDGSLIRGAVRLDPSLSEVGGVGTLVVALTHQNLGNGENGGFLHTGVVLPGVDLAAGPVPFEIDMCTEGAMWSEHNCEYNLIAVLDTGGDNSPSYLLPAKGEAAVRMPDLWVSCQNDSPCLDVVLDCTDGSACIAYDAPYFQCECTETTCRSDVGICN